MTPFTRVCGRAYPLALDNIDTDLIIPAEHLKTVTRAGLGRFAFEALRAQPGNVFDDPHFAGAPILLALANFGCGSSREHAAWALADLGVRAVIAVSFSDIFASNAFKNGIAAISLDKAAVQSLIEAAPDHAITVDLEQQLVRSANGHFYPIHMDPFRRQCLLAGQDEIALTLQSEAAISAFERASEQAQA
ncbi:3-isopropylmalate dehydratase small subunit [Sphingomonas glaciei]|uniref:3-isopropylmalate dehydratase small subunit n=1 Tax=Sphingomonas glaciei TaxID=2938948 RepID=A0ABY5MV33_9SPHN|nr:3-isopropylmalate dehydratase small subunit [Sphingomonas glaciei]UUR08345.1 3-isopropylmalate dehydratase small subunit [Sphingomonas glaciei]